MKRYRRQKDSFPYYLEQKDKKLGIGGAVLWQTRQGGLNLECATLAWPYIVLSDIADKYQVDAVGFLQNKGTYYYGYLFNLIMVLCTVKREYFLIF